MADLQAHIGLINYDTATPLVMSLHDNGDGTYAPVLWVGATITATIGSLQIPDGQDVGIGATTDAAVAGDTAGSANAKLRGLNTVLGAVADVAWTSGSGSVVALLKAVAGLLAKGTRTAAASISTSFATDQTGAAGSPSATVLSVQGVASGTAQPVSGTVVADAGTNLNTSALAKEAGGNLAAAVADLDTIAANTAPAPTEYEQAHDFATTGSGPTLDLSAGKGLVYSMQITSDDVPTSWTVLLEGSLDGANWTPTAHPIITHSDTAFGLNGVASATAKPLRYVRATCTALVLGATATKITAHLLALR